MSRKRILIFLLGLTAACVMADIHSAMAKIIKAKCPGGNKSYARVTLDGKLWDKFADRDDCKTKMTIPDFSNPQISFKSTCRNPYLGGCKIEGDGTFLGLVPDDLAKGVKSNLPEQAGGYVLFKIGSNNQEFAKDTNSAQAANTGVGKGWIGEQKDVFAWGAVPAEKRALIDDLKPGQSITLRGTPARVVILPSFVVYRFVMIDAVEKIGGAPEAPTPPPAGAEMGK